MTTVSSLREDLGRSFLRGTRANALALGSNGVSWASNKLAASSVQTGGIVAMITEFAASGLRLYRAAMTQVTPAYVRSAFKTVA